MNSSPEKIVHHHFTYDSKAFILTVVLFSFFFVCSAVWYRSMGDADLVYEQSETIQGMIEKNEENHQRIFDLHQLNAFMGGQLIEQANILKRECSDVVELLEDHLLKQEQMVSDIISPKGKQ